MKTTLVLLCMKNKNHEKAWMFCCVFLTKVVAFVRATMEGDRSLFSSSEKVVGLCIQDKIIKKGLGGCLGRPKKY